VRRAHSGSEPQGEPLGRLRELETKAGTWPLLTGGNPDANWQRAVSSEVRTSEGIVRNRNRRYRGLERKADDDKRST
jgi:hypothetical protein